MLPLHKNKYQTQELERFISGTTVPSSHTFYCTTKIVTNVIKYKTDFQVCVQSWGINEPYMTLDGKSQFQWVKVKVKVTVWMSPLTVKAKVSASMSLFIFFTSSFNEVNTVHAFFVWRKTYTTLFWMSNENLKHYEESFVSNSKSSSPSDKCMHGR